MISKKTLKKISKVIFVLLIILWFGGNLAIYIFAEYMFSNTLDIINSQPEKKTISENTNPANSFHILGVSLDLLPITNIYKNVVPFFHDHKMRDLSISFSDSQKIFFIHMLDYDDSNSWDTCDKSFYARAKDFLMIKESNWYDYIWASEQVTMNDFSWWNPIHNIRLTMLLIVK